MITKEELNSLQEREWKEGSPVLSVYLDTDQSQEPNIERGFEVVLKNLLRDLREPLDKKTRVTFEEDAERVRAFLNEYRDVSRGLVIFCDASEKFLWYRDLNVKVRDGAWWNETPYVRPLVEIMDEHERYGVILSDRQHARLFTVFLGEIEEHQEAFAPLDVTRVQGPGQERAWAQLKLQHKADQHAHLHFKQVAEKISKLAQVHNFDRLILAGPVEATSELERLLPKALRTRLVDVLALPVDANDAQVLQETTRIENEIERKREAELVESLITAAAKHQPAVVGLDEILIALQEWRIGQLIYADGYNAPGGQCTNCEALLAEAREPCTYCGSPVRELYDLVAVAHERVLHLNQKVEQVSGEAAKRMHEVGDIGAFLRY